MSDERPDGAESFGDWFGARWRIVEPPPATEAPRLGAEEEDFSIEQEPVTFIDAEKLKDASKWAAAGFSAATALLVFFGVKEGVLDQAIRLNPLPTLCVFMLLGIGVVSALFVGAIDKNVLIRLWAVIAALIVMIGLTAIYLPNFQAPPDSTVPKGSSEGLALWLTMLRFVIAGLLGVAVVLAIPLLVARSRETTGKRQALYVAGVVVAAIVLLGIVALASASRQTLLALATGAVFLLGMAWSFVRKTVLPAVAAVVILGVAATSLGLYGIAKLSVQSKLLAVKPRVLATLEQADGRTSLRIAAAARMRDKKLLITVTGKPRLETLQPSGENSASEEIWRTVLEPDVLDEIETTITVPLTPPRWEQVTVFHCRVDEVNSQECEDESEGTQVLSTKNLLAPGAEITGHIIASSKSLQVTLTGSNVAWGNRIQAEICRVRKGGHATQLAYATLSPNADGAVTWKVPVPAGRDGDGLVLQYRQCRRGSGCPSMTKLAKYTLP